MIESINQALVECIKALGGSKQIGPKLWPEKTPDAAQRLLLDCLNEDRPARLTPEQVLLIMRLARGKGCHVAMQFICDDLGYADPVPVDPKDELAELLRQSIEARAKQTAMDERIARLLQSGTLRSVA